MNFYKEDIQQLLDLSENRSVYLEEALNDLDLMQKKTQFELIGNIVTVALWTIMGVKYASENGNKEDK